VAQERLICADQRIDQARATGVRKQGRHPIGNMGRATLRRPACNAEPAKAILNHALVLRQAARFDATTSTR
jgi:hypothetical protein